MRVPGLAPIVLVCTLVVAVRAPAAAQQDLTTSLSTIEKALWQAWKDHDAAPFEKYLTDDAVNVSADGVTTGKATFLEMLRSQPCDVNGFTFSDWAVHRVTDDVAILTYSATQDGSCGGETLASSLNVSSVYVRKDGMWMSAAYHETPTGSGM